MNKIKMYNGEVTLTFDEEKHVYYLNGERLSGVTTVLNRINKPFLMYWAVKMAAEYLEKNLEPGIAYDEMEKRDLILNAKRAHVEFKNKAGDKGTFVHDWIEDFLRGNNPKLPINEELKGVIQDFLDWYKTVKVRNANPEKFLCSPTLKLAGKVDLIGDVDDRFSILDWKTGSGIYPEQFLQMGAYSLMYEEEFGKKVERVGIINCSIKNGFSYKFYDNVDLLKDLYKLILNFDQEYSKLEKEI